MRGRTALKFSPYFFPLSRSRLKIEKSTQYHGTVENREQRTAQNTPEKAASQFESCLRNHKTADFVRNQRFSFLKNSGNELLARTSFPGCLTGRGIAASEKMRMGMVSAVFYWNGPAMMPSWAVRPGGPLHRPWPQTGPPSGSLRSGSRTARGPPEAGPDAEWRRNREAGVSAREEGSSPEG